MMSVGQGYWVYLVAWVVLHFTWQGLFLLISWQACDRIMSAAPPQARYRAACFHLTALAAAPLFTLLVSQRALQASMAAGPWAPRPPGYRASAVHSHLYGLCFIYWPGFFLAFLSYGLWACWSVPASFSAAARAIGVWLPYVLPPPSCCPWSMNSPAN